MSSSYTERGISKLLQPSPLHPKESQVHATDPTPPTNPSANQQSELYPNSQVQSSSNASASVPSISAKNTGVIVGQYRIIKTIGKGNFAKVKLAQHTITKRNVAIKVVDKVKMNPSGLHKLMREVRIMKMLDHPNIVKLYEVMESDTTLYLVIEYCEGGEVFDYLVSHGRMKEKEARDKFRQILSAVNYCHRMFVIHRDLKAENLLLDASLNIKIADFGFSNQYHPERKLETFCGSPPYAAPELFLGQKYTGPEVDVWSLGVILYTLVSGSLPFDGQNIKELRAKVLKGEFRIPFYMSNSCEKLINRMLVIDTHKRITLESVMSDPWINEDMPPLKPYHSIPATFDEHRIKNLINFGFTMDEISRSLKEKRYDAVMATYMLLDTRRSGPDDYMNSDDLQHTIVSVNLDELSHCGSFSHNRRTGTLGDGNSPGFSPLHQSHHHNDVSGSPIFTRSLAGIMKNVRKKQETSKDSSPNPNSVINDSLSIPVSTVRRNTFNVPGDHERTSQNRYSAPRQSTITPTPPNTEHDRFSQSPYSAARLKASLAGTLSAPNDYTTSPKYLNRESEIKHDDDATDTSVNNSPGSIPGKRKGIIERLSNRLRKTSIVSAQTSRTAPHSPRSTNVSNAENSPVSPDSANSTSKDDRILGRKFSFGGDTIPSHSQHNDSNNYPPEPRSLKFTFNFKTTSTKHAIDILHEIERVLLMFSIEFQQVESFTFQCYYDFASSSLANRTDQRRYSFEGQSPVSSNSRAIETSIRNGTGKIRERTNTDHRRIPLVIDQNVTYYANQAVQWEVEVCKLPWLFMNAVRFKRISGEAFLYKAIVSRLSDEMNL